MAEAARGLLVGALDCVSLNSTLCSRPALQTIASAPAVVMSPCSSSMPKP
jgi:hypothetical protein